MGNSDDDGAFEANDLIQEANVSHPATIRSHYLIVL
jgi:hypothetical protein